MSRPDAVVLVGHGGVPRDCPRELVQRLKALEAGRRGSGLPPGEEERALDERIRRWPRTATTDPYGAGLARVAEALRPLLGATELVVAFNEFCAPSLTEAIEDLVARGRQHIVVLPSMLTPGGVHSEVDIPEELAALRARHPEVAIGYAWPFDLAAVARLLASQALGGEGCEGTTAWR